jgi:hypothetical protein
VTTPTPTPVVTPTPPTPLVTFSGDANTPTNHADIIVDDTDYASTEIDSSTFTPAQDWNLTITWTCSVTMNNGRVVPSFAVFDTTTGQNIGSVWQNPAQQLSGTITIPETVINDTLKIETYVQPCTWTVVAQ